MKILAMGIDVVVGNFVDAFGALGNIHAGLDGCESGVLRAENDFIDFPLARRELPVGWNRARDVGGVAGVLRADVEDDDVAIFDFASQLVVVQRGGIGAGADDGGVAFASDRPWRGLRPSSRRFVFVQAGRIMRMASRCASSESSMACVRNAISPGDLIWRSSLMLERMSFSLICGTVV